MRSFSMVSLYSFGSSIVTSAELHDEIARVSVLAGRLVIVLFSSDPSS